MRHEYGLLVPVRSRTRRYEPRFDLEIAVGPWTRVSQSKQPSEGVRLYAKDDGNLTRDRKSYYLFFSYLFSFCAWTYLSHAWHKYTDGRLEVGLARWEYLRRRVPRWPKIEQTDADAGPADITYVLVCDMAWLQVLQARSMSHHRMTSLFLSAYHSSCRCRCSGRYCFAISRSRSICVCTSSSFPLQLEQ